MNRRSFLTKATVAGSVLMGGAIFQSCKSSGNKIKPLMRLDSHIHLYDGGGNIEMIRQYFIDEKLTHGQVIVRSTDLHLIPEIRAIAPGIIPFEWPQNPLELEVKEETPVLGYKIHLRKPLNYEADGQPVTASSKALDPICTAAENLGRPFLFHSDADNPQICTLPQMAELAGRHKHTAFIAAHTAAYTQEYQGEPNTIEAWEAMLPAILAENFNLLLDVENLYADTVLIGRDYPERSSNPRFKLDLMINLVAGMSKAKRKALVNKLFIGTDFPWFHKYDDPKGGYQYQVDCMREIFPDEFDETEMAKNFIALLPL